MDDMDTTAYQQELKNFLSELPKAELHFHFEGAVPWPTIRRLHPDKTALPLLPPWHGPACLNTFEDFLEVFRNFIRPCLHSIENYLEAGADIIQWLIENKLDYVEWNVSLRVMKDNNIPIRECFMALDELINQHTAPGTPVIRLIAGMNREFNLQQKFEFLTEIQALHNLAGLDVHGWENELDLAHNEQFFEAIRQKSWKIKVHAGELAGPANVRFVIDQLGINHIGHGVRAAEDNELLNSIAERNIFLELCPSSNLCLGVVDNVQSYPLKRMLDVGVKATLNTDDPMIFNCTLLDQFLLAASMGLSPLDLAVCTVNAFEASLLPAARKKFFQQKCLDLAHTFLSETS